MPVYKVKGPIAIYAYGDVVQLSRSSQEALVASGISLNHVPRVYISTVTPNNNGSPNIYLDDHTYLNFTKGISCSRILLGIMHCI